MGSIRFRPFVNASIIVGFVMIFFVMLCSHLRNCFRWRTKRTDHLCCLNLSSSEAVAITQLFWRPRGLLVDQFDSKEDLVNALFTSSFIPGYAGFFCLLYYYFALASFSTTFFLRNKRKKDLLSWSRYLAPRPATMFRNRLCIDGGLTLFMPPTSASETVRFVFYFILLGQLFFFPELIGFDIYISSNLDFCLVLHLRLYID